MLLRRYAVWIVTGSARRLRFSTLGVNGVVLEALGSVENNIFVVALETQCVVRRDIRCAVGVREVSLEKLVVGGAVWSLWPGAAAAIAGASIVAVAVSTLHDAAGRPGRN